MNMIFILSSVLCVLFVCFVKLHDFIISFLFVLGLGLFHVGDYKLSITALNTALEHSSSSSNNNNDGATNDQEHEPRMHAYPYATISTHDHERIKIFIDKANVKYQAEQRHKEIHKKALQKIFSSETKTSSISPPATIASTEPSTITNTIIQFFQFIFTWIVSVLSHLIHGRGNVNKKDS